MKESNLAKAIDKAAERRAEDIARDIQRAVVEAVKPHWRPKLAGEHYIGEDVRATLQMLAASNDWSTAKRRPSKELIEACRAAVINELLTGLPKLRELVLMDELNWSDE